MEINHCKTHYRIQESYRIKRKLQATWILEAKMNKYLFEVHPTWFSFCLLWRGHIYVLAVFNAFCEAHFPLSTLYNYTNIRMIRAKLCVFAMPLYPCNFLMDYHAALFHVQAIISFLLFSHLEWSLCWLFNIVRK